MSDPSVENPSSALAPGGATSCSSGLALASPSAPCCSGESRSAEEVIAYSKNELGFELTPWQERLMKLMIENPDKTIEMRTGRKGPHWALVEKEANG